MRLLVTEYLNWFYHDKNISYSMRGEDSIHITIMIYLKKGLMTKREQSISCSKI